MSDVGAEDSAGSVVWLSPDPPGWIADFSLVPLASQFSQISWPRKLFQNNLCSGIPEGSVQS